VLAGRGRSARTISVQRLPWRLARNARYERGVSPMIVLVGSLKADATDEQSRHYEQSSAPQKPPVDTNGFCWHRRKPIASRLAIGLSGAGRVSGRVHQSDTTMMHDLRRHDGFDREFDRFDSVLPAAVKSQSQDGSTVYYNLTDLTSSLSGGTCAREALTLSCLSPFLPSERFGQISQIGVRPFAVLRFSVDRAGSTGVKRQSKAGQTRGVAA